VASTVDVAAAVLAILVVRRLTSRQRARELMLAELRASSSDAGTPALE